MNSRLFALIFAFAGCTVMSGVPAKQEPITVVNSDGTVLTIVLCGDECCHFYTTLDGVPVVQEDNGDYRIAPELADSISTLWQTRSRRRNAMRTARAEARRAKARYGANRPNAYRGSKRGIVLLADFSNLSMKSTSTPEAFYRQFNETGYHENNHYGSVRDYFYDQSYGQFDLTFDVYGPVKVSRTYGYYGKNNNGDDMHVAELAAEVCEKADQEYPINWSDYDWDGDGEVDQVLIIYAGYGENAAGARSDYIWPHEWTLTEGLEYNDGNGPITLGGCTIDTYAMTCELSGSRGSTMNGIGTACHEFSHCLGLPDFYDTTYSGGFGMNYWDVMANGSNAGKTKNGEHPVGFTAYERWFAGWLDFIELDQSAIITDMPSLQDTAVAYIIYNDNNPNEYFTLENRQNNGWFTYTETYRSCHGLLVCHVDYDEKYWNFQQPDETVLQMPNDEKDHQRMTIIPAGKNYGTYSNRSYTVSESVYRSQLFPGLKSVTELTNTSHEQAGGRLFTPNTDGSYCMNKPVTEITETDGLISFKFMGGKSNAISSIYGDSSHDKPEYFTLDGIKVERPVSPGIYILRQGSETKKILIK
ncbi:MAG: M6 family metalloprotease domain-containing protein [Bacteroidaceae bacterium]|nr:M6 family metalloprotease domain-containing protein [Bacteroidaceae bacterium]